MRHALFVVLSACLAQSACQRTNERSALAGVHHDHPEEVPAKPPADTRPAVPADVVFRGELPFQGFRDRDETRLAPVDFFDELSEADVICVGEDHENPHDHWAELKVLHALFERTSMNGKELALGLEMVDRSRQSVLDRFAKSELDEDEFLKESQWSERWGYDFAYYRPQVELMQDHDLTLLALNLPKEVSHKLAHGGVDSLSDSERALLPDDIDTTDVDHRAWFDAVMKSHPPPPSDRDNVYLAQVAWDETMADNAARWIKRRVPGRQLVIFAGSGHCRADGIPNRIARRVRANVRSVRPLVMNENERPGSNLDGYDYAFLMIKDAD